MKRLLGGRARVFSVTSPGEYELDSIPSSTIGTLWFWTSGAAKLGKVTASTDEHSVTQKRSSLEGILLSNIGKKLRLGLKNGDEVTGTAKSGKLLAFENEIAILETDQGTMVIPRTAITSIAADGETLTIDETLTTPSRVLRFKIDGGGGKVRMLSIEQGLTWSPSYAVEVTDDKKLKLTAKCVVVDDLDNLDKISARFITGFPNIPFLGTLDPLIVANMEAFNSSLFTRGATDIVNGQNPVLMGGAGGQLAGGQGLTNSLPFVSYDPKDNSARNLQQLCRLTMPNSGVGPGQQS